MPGFHPVLGLLALAVCISDSQGAPFSNVLKDDITAHKQHNALPHRSASTLKKDGQLARTLFIKNNKITKRDDSQDRNVGDDRKYENVIQVAGIAKFNGLRSTDTDAVLTKANPAESGSGELNLDTREDSGTLQHKDKSESYEESSSGSGQSNELPADDAIPTSQSEEDCSEEDNGVNDTVSPTEDTTAPTPTPTPNDEDEECEESEAPATPTTATSTTTTTTTTESTISQSSESSSESQESPEDEDCDEGTSTTTTTTESGQPRPSPTPKPTKKPRDPDDSSGSFHDSDSKGVDFSDSFSRESDGRSTALSDEETK